MFGVKELDAKAANALSNAVEEGTAMPEFFVYAGLAGDTDPGRYWSALSIIRPVGGASPSPSEKA